MASPSQQRALHTVQRVQGSSFDIALIQLGDIGTDKAKNIDNARRKMDEAMQVKQPPHLLVLPECFNSPYGVDFFPEYAETIPFRPGQTQPTLHEKAVSAGSPSVDMLSRTARDHKIWLIGGSIPERDASTGKLYNTATVYNTAGDLIAVHRKLHLFDIDIPGGITFKESQTLTGGDRVTLVDTDMGRLGLGICYDLRFPEMAMIAARKGAMAMIYPGAFNTTTGPPYWEILQRARAVDNQIFVAACSPARPESGYPAYGFSMVTDPTGKVIAGAKEAPETVYACIDVETINKTRQGVPITAQRRFDAYPDVASGTSS
ncbi:uncharacterized protein L969DRAFT_93583 [Mixia osmundae IAM 14324]|uniref:CN hydrolase domain-containing protein n=1 Tax=Mixia osmundae (strain CBS 9802 / IAM 14324 / JCM 22182 / KY 12970) TaxID=764103 RepID=G7DUE1_MIXOS|nr:uncharacterized protein L969DRAFT_93583 [Mixia osmundae IAM 14324]KEI41073.1 hypothetical protein L969DRAFT_93583 [Mixia osmundae IAM 14324]GAA94201.1 hypothetical protein E5Q_00849 [Mixia osmundae IAM 14324]